MKNLNIKARITLLCVLLTAAVAALSIAVLEINESGTMRRYYENTLISAATLAEDDIGYKRGKLNIGRELDNLPNVRIALYDLDGDLIYGRTMFEAEFREDALRAASGDQTGVWYFYDRKVLFSEGEAVWIRCSISADVDNHLRSGQTLLLLALIPVLVLIAGIGGYFIAKRAFWSVSQITATAGEIADSSDLKKRIELPNSHDELYRLGKVFNDMLSRLDGAFEREQRFSADVAHELRTPITAIMSQSEFALSEGADEEDKQDALAVIHQKALGMRELTVKLMMLSRMESGQQQLSMELIDMGLLCELAAESCMERAQERNIRITVQIEDEVAVMGDQTMLTQAVINVIENGIKYGREGGYIEASVARVDDKALLRVRDNGCGMSEEQKSHVFERFYQADGSRNQSGAGLGLPLSARILEMHGGRIEVESVAGEGSCFTIELPLAEDPQDGFDAI